MNMNDLTNLEKYNERYTAVNMTRFALVDATTSVETLLNHIKTDLDILISSDVENKNLCRLIISDDIIDICTKDNGTYISYFFCEEALFTPESIELDLEDICENYEIGLDRL